MPDEERIPPIDTNIPQNHGKRRIIIQEEANTVREIPQENNGKRKAKKRYSTEPSWLDRYRNDNADEEFLEEFHATLDSELEGLSPSQESKPLTVKGAAIRNSTGYSNELQN